MIRNEFYENESSALVLYAERCCLKDHANNISTPREASRKQSTSNRQREIVEANKLPLTKLKSTKIG